MAMRGEDLTEDEVQNLAAKSQEILDLLTVLEDSLGAPKELNERVIDHKICTANSNQKSAKEIRLMNHWIHWRYALISAVIGASDS